MVDVSSFLRLVAVYALIAICSAQLTENAKERFQEALPFVAYPQVFDGILVENLETPLAFRALLYLNLANWNAWCNYHPTAVDIFGRSRFKRPLREHTVRNKNIAALYALLRMYEASPQSFGGASGLPNFRRLMRERRLDPDDRSLNMSSPIGIGNREGMDTARLLLNDGWNSEGDIGDTTPGYRLPFFDFTGYVPRNNPWRLQFPFRWQPFLETDGVGFYFRQEHVTPFAGSQIAFSLSRTEVQRKRVRSPYRNRWARRGREKLGDLKTLRRLARGVFQTSAHLSIRRRLLAELLDNKVNAFRTKKNPTGVPSIGSALRFFILGNALDWNLNDDVIFGLATNIAVFDAMVVVWKEKLRHDAVRPSGQTMEYLFGNRRFPAFGRRGRTKIRAGEFQPYIRTMPHSEFPSASACVCQAVVDHALIASKGRNFFPYNITIPKGSSKLYPGEFPSHDVIIPINKLTEWNRICGESRLWAGVHFRPAVPEGQRLCKGIGRSAQDLVDRLLSGKADLTWASWLRGKERWWEY